MTHRILLALALTPVLLGCGGGGDTFTAFVPDLGALDADGDGQRRYPYGSDLDDDGDGAETYLAGGSDYDDGSAAVQDNGGTGAFAATALTYPAGNTPRAAALGDVDGDGDLDVAVIVQDDELVLVYPGIGDGTLGTPTPWALPPGGGTSDVAFGDFDEDGNLDMVAGEGHVFRGTGTGGFFTPTQIPFSNPSTLIVRDYDSDGHLDVVAAEYDIGVAVALGRGDGTFETPLATPLVETYEIALADLNGDGILDAVAARGASGVAVFLGTAGGGFAAGSAFAVPTSAFALATADVNGDGTVDVVTTGVTSDTHVLPGDGAGGLGAALTNAVPGTPQALVLERFLGGGPVHAVFGTGSGFVLAVGGGDGTFSPVGAIPPAEYVQSMAVGDLNGDGIVDLVGVYTSNDEIGVVLGQ